MANPEVIVDIKAKDDTGPGVRKAKGSIGGLGSAASALAGPVGIGVGAIVAVGAVSFGAVKDLANLGDEISKLSDRTNVSAEALSAYKYQFEQADLSSADLEKTFRRLNVRVLSSESRTKAAGRAIEGLGLDINEIEKMSPDEAFRTIAQAISEVESPAEQAGIASEIFGKKLGPDLLTVLQQGEQGIDDYAKKAEDLGQVIDQKTADQGAEFNDSLQDLGKTFTSLGRELGAILLPIFLDLIKNLLPPFKTLIQGISPILRIIGTVIGVIAELFGKWIGLIVEFIASTGIFDFLNAVADQFTSVGDAVTGVGGIFERVFNFIKVLIESYVRVYIAFIKDFVFALVSYIQTGMNTWINIINAGLSAGQGLFNFFVKGVLSIIDGLINLVGGAINSLLDAGGVLTAGIGRIETSNLAGGFEGIQLGRIDTVDLVGGLGLTGGNLATAVGEAGTNIHNAITVNVQGSVVSEDELGGMINQVAQTGLISG